MAGVKITGDGVAHTCIGREPKGDHHDHQAPNATRVLTRTHLSPLHIAGSKFRLHVTVGKV